MPLIQPPLPFVVKSPLILKSITHHEDAALHEGHEEKQQRAS